MKLPRSLVIAMLATSILAMMVTAARFWVRWPVRTAREFTGLMRNARIPEAIQMLGLPPMTPEQLWIAREEGSFRPEQYRLVLNPRDVPSILRGRQHFRLVFNFHGQELHQDLVAERGIVKVESGEFILW